MHFGQPVKEKLARVIADHFTTQQIESVFKNANVPTDRVLFAKWKITLDAFGKMPQTEAAIAGVLEDFGHPLRFDDPDERKKFARDLNKVLKYAKGEMKMTDLGAEILDEHGFPATYPEFEPPVAKTPAEYVRDVIAFFKDEYNKVLIAGLAYEYCLGEAANLDGRYTDEYLGRQKAIEQLKRIGFITELEYTQDIDDDNTVYDVATCKIDENKLTQKEEPKATAAGAEAIAQKVVHEHTHRFENSIQEKDIALNHKFPEQKPSGFYITKKDDDFWHKGRRLNLSKSADYNQVFAALYAKLPEGGEISYSDLGTEIESRLFKAKGKSADEMRKFIQRNLTDRSNGFVRYASIPETEDNGKPLIEVVRNSGVRFNNKAG
jgi:hypothetical protein